MTGSGSPRTRWTLPYRAMRGKDGDGTTWNGGLLPSVEIEFVKPGGGVYSIGTLGLVDSGCDRSALPSAWAKHLGIDLDECDESPARTAGGLTTNFVHAPGIDVVILGQQITLQASFNSTLPWVLLGREDFFRHFRVAFHHRDQQLTLQLYP